MPIHAMAAISSSSFTLQTCSANPLATADELPGDDPCFHGAAHWPTMLQPWPFARAEPDAADSVASSAAAR